MKKIRMGIIGCGGISGLHIDGILSSPDAELVALCDVNREILYEKSEKYGIPGTHCFSDPMALMDCPDVDAVSICTPNDSHFAIAREAILREKPFALEKPVALTSGEARALRDMAAKVTNMVCFSYRFKSAARYARWLVRNGYLGSIRHVYVQYLQSWANSESLPLLWRFRREFSGSGALGDLGSHMLDLIRFIVGDYVKVCAQAGTFIDRRRKINSQDYDLVDVDDYCNFIAELEGGIPASFNITRYAYGRGNYQKIQIFGSRGGLEYTLDENGDGVDSIRICSGELYEKARVYSLIPVPDEFRSDQMQSFFDMVRGKGDGLAATLNDGYVNQCLLDFIIESFETEKWIYLNERDM